MYRPMSHHELRLALLQMLRAEDCSQPRGIGGSLGGPVAVPKTLPDSGAISPKVNVQGSQRPVEGAGHWVTYGELWGVTAEECS